MASGGFAKSRIIQTFALACLGVLTAALCITVLTRDVSADISASDSQVTDPAGTSDGPTPADPSASATSEPPSDPPRVPNLRSADFTDGDDLPDGALVLDNEAVGQAMALADGVLTHGTPTGPGAVSSLETQLETPVRKLGARVRFADDNSGSVVLVAWSQSLVSAREAGDPVPTSGMRLVAGPASWELTVYDRRPETIASGTFAPVTGAAQFVVYRTDADLWVVAPDGSVTQVEDARAASFAGPWACWQLLETKAGQTPAAIEAVAAG